MKRAKAKTAGADNLLPSLVANAFKGDQKDPPPADAGPPAAKKLTPEEQWDLFEKDLKENDWGHRPC